MYTAVIIEPRQHPAFLYVIKNALTVLDCNIIIYHGNLNKEFVENMIEPLKDNHRIRLIHLNVNNFTPQQYSVFLKTNKKFYASIPTDKFLIFQTDSILFEKNKRLIHHFLKYDYVGAPWTWDLLNGVGNGGLSIRKKSKMLEIIEKEPYNDQPEDIFFAMNKTVPLYKPSVREAKHFSVEHLYESFTFGSHQPWIQKHTNFYTLYPELVEFEKLHGK
jgi:hypothetical protein